MYAMLGRHIAVLWGFQRNSRLLGISDFTDKHQHPKCQQNIIFTIKNHYYESAFEPQLFHQAGFFISQLQNDHHISYNSYNVDRGIIADKLNRAR